MIALDGSTVYPILSAIKHSFGVDERLIVWVFNIEILFLMLATPISAKLADIFGRRRTYVFSAILFLSGTLIATVSHSFPLFLLGRAFQGAGAVTSFLAITIIGDHFSENRGQMLGIFGVVLGIVYAIGPILSGFLVNYDWHYIFALNLPIASVVVLLGFFLLPKEEQYNKNKLFDWKGMTFLGIAIASFACFVNEFNGWPVSFHLWVVLVVCAICLFLFWRSEQNVKEQILPLNLLKRRNTLIVSITAVVGYLAGAGTYFLSTFAVMAFGLDYSQGAYILLPFTAFSLLATIVVGKLLDKIGAKPIMVVGGIISTLGIFILSISHNVYIFGLSLVLIGVGNASIAGNALYFLMLEETGKSDRASGQGMLNLLLNTGALMGGALLGVVLNTGGGECLPTFRTVYLGLALLYLLLTFIVMGLKSTEYPKTVNSD